MNAAGLHRVITDYVTYYMRSRTHLALGRSGGSPGEPLCQIVLVGRPKCDWREPFVTRREVAFREDHERVVLSGVERLDTEATWVKVMIEAAVRKKVVEVIDRTEDRIW